MISALTGEPIVDVLLREERREARRKVADRADVLRPDGQPSNRWMDLALRLANRYSCELYTDTYAWARAKARAIGTPAIDSEEALAQFAHEVGHLENRVADPQMFVVKTEDAGSFEYSLLSECAAWRFAFGALKWEWSPRMQQEMERCLRSYQPHVVKSRTDLDQLEAVIAQGRDALRHVVRIR